VTAALCTEAFAKHRHQDLQAGRDQRDIAHSKILTLQNYVRVTIAKVDRDNFQITAYPTVSTILQDGFERCPPGQRLLSGL